jgi:outer membrane protein assembly factor BamB
MRRIGTLVCISFLVLLLAACGPAEDQAPAANTVVATETASPVVITVVVSPTPMADEEGQPAPATTEVTVDIPPSPATDVLSEPTAQVADVLQEPGRQASDVFPQPSAPAPTLAQVQPRSGQDWTSSAHGDAASTRYNPTSLSPPLQLLWEWDDGGRSGPGALAIVDQKLYVPTTQGNLHILDATTGWERTNTLLWADGGHLSDVVVTGDTVIACTADWIGGRHPQYPARVVALDLEGRRRWELELPGEQGPCYLVADAGLVAVAPAGDGRYANWLAVYDAITGQQRWQQTLPEWRHFRPLVSDGTTLYVSQSIGEGGGLVAYDLASGQVRWQQTAKQVWSARSAAVSNGQLYTAGTHGPLSILDAGTGQIIWQTPFEDSFSGGLALAHGQLYLDRQSLNVAPYDKEKGLYALDAATGNQRWVALKGEDVLFIVASQTHVLAMTRQASDSSASILHLLDPTSGLERDRVTVPNWERDVLSGGLAVASGRVYAACWDGLRVYGPGQAGTPVPTSTPRPTPTTPPTAVPPTPTTKAQPQPTPTAQHPVTGRYSEVWARLGGTGGRLGQPLAPAVEGFFAEQHFERGLMHWGRLDQTGEPEPEVHVIVYGAGNNRRAGTLWGRFIDYWKEGQDEYSCPEATPPWGPRRGFGLVWCQYVRDSVGSPLEEEYGRQASYQDFQGGTMLWSPTDGGVYVLFNQGDWQFEATE